mgnify:CR=1 FL=1
MFRAGQNDNLIPPATARALRSACNVFSQIPDFRRHGKRRRRSPAHRGTARPVAEVGHGTRSAGRAGGQGLFESIAGYLAAGSQNAALKREVELARIRLKDDHQAKYPRG